MVVNKQLNFQKYYCCCSQAILIAVVLVVVSDEWIQTQLYDDEPRSSRLHSVFFVSFYYHF